MIFPKWECLFLILLFNVTAFVPLVPCQLEDCKVLKGLRTFHHSYKVAFYLIYIIKNCNRDIQILWNQIDPCHSHCFSDSRNIMLLGSQTIINLRVFQDICQSSISIQLFHVIDIIIKFQKFTTSHGTFV